MAQGTSIVIPNYNGAGYYKKCLDSLRNQTLPPDRIIVVDNGSTDGSPEAIAREFPEVRLIRFTENTGFCGAVNAGIRASQDEEFVILLNNDTWADPDFTAEMVRVMKKNERIFSCQAKMLKMENPNAIDDAGDYYCALGWAFAGGKGRSAEEYRRPKKIFSSCAGAAIYRMSLIKKIGMFDENHFAYLEDTDIGWRARIYGYINVFAPRAHVLHVGSASSGSIYNFFKVHNTSRNSIYLIYKNMPGPQIILNLPFLIPGFLIKAAFFILKGFGKEYIQGIRQGFLLCEKGRVEGKKVPFRKEHMASYVQIQAELWINVIRRFSRRG